MRRKSGQILVLVLLVVVIALAVGLSAASRNLVNLRSSTQAEQSERAFTAAEGGVEDVLSKLTDVGTAISGGAGVTGCTIDGANSTADCALPTNSNSTVSGKVQVVQKRGYERVVGLGEVAQVNLDSSPLLSGTLKVEWIKTGNNQESTLEFIFVCQGLSGAECVTGDTTIASNGYGQHREAAKNPDPAYQPAGQSGVAGCDDATSDGYTCMKTFTITGNEKILRIKPFWNNTTVKISYSATGTTPDLPVQTYEITSTATTETGVSRKVAVTRDALPQLPAIFDYVLYSGGDIIK